MPRGDEAKGRGTLDAQAKAWRGPGQLDKVFVRGCRVWKGAAYIGEGREEGHAGVSTEQCDVGADDPKRPVPDSWPPLVSPLPALATKQTYVTYSNHAI